VGGRFNSPTHGRPPYSFILSRGPTTIITITTCIRLLHNQQKQNKTSKSSPPLFLWSLRLQQLDCCYYQVMKTLTSSCSNVILDKKGDNRPVFSFRELRHEVSILPSKKLVHSVGFLHWLCVKHKPICPIRVSSSFSPESQACNLFCYFSLALCIS